MVGAVCHERGEGELPFTQASVEVGGSGARDHDCHEMSSVRLSEKRGKKDEEEGDQDGTENRHDGGLLGH